ncbi:MAG TPA: hypothetical protein VJ910_13480 [Desulfuromonadales bacterium]|nr:hypothetical protein [Desulfuromonadales bacterium]
MNKDNVLNVNQQSPQKQARFLAAWKRGVTYLGAELFGPGTPETARDKNQLRPLPDAVEVIFSRESLGEEQFLAAMVSFFDPAWGEELTDRIDDYKCVAGLTYNLDHECIEILCELLRNYEGW